MNDAAISIVGLEKSYKTFQALKGIDLTVREGDFVGFLGPNGAGKTTTIHCVTGLCNFQKGSIRVFGQDVVNDYRKTRPLIGLCPQEFNLDPFLTISQLLVYQAGYFGVPKIDALKRADQLLRYFRLHEKKDLDFRKLSGGMKRRLLLCRALMHDPKILILDEPTAGADLALRHHIWQYLQELNQKGKTIFLTTHYMEEAEKLSKTVAIIDKGRIVHFGDKETLLKNESLETKFLQLTQSGESDD